MSNELEDIFEIGKRLTSTAEEGNTNTFSSLNKRTATNDIHLLSQQTLQNIHNKQDNYIPKSKQRKSKYSNSVITKQDNDIIELEVVPPQKTDLNKLLSGTSIVLDTPATEALKYSDNIELDSAELDNVFAEDENQQEFNLQNDTAALRALIQSTLDKILDNIDVSLARHEAMAPATWSAEADYLSQLTGSDADDTDLTSLPDTNNNDINNMNEKDVLEDMLKNERLSSLTQKLEDSYEKILNILLRATASQTVPENLDFWNKINDLLKDPVYLVRQRRSYRHHRRQHRRRQRMMRMRKFRLRMRQHIRRQLAITYGHVSPCPWRDRFYCMNGGTCVIIGDLDVKTCRSV